MIALAAAMAMIQPDFSVPPKGYVCTRVTEPVRFDGKLNEGAWAAAPWTDAFVDIEGDKKPKPRFLTRAKMLWDDEFFYVAAEMEEPNVWATLTQHDSVIFHDNDFEVFIDPDGDNHRYYEFEINALNTTWDLFLPRPYRDGGPAMNAWEIPGLRSAVHVRGTLNDPSDTDEGWTVEIAFPWSVLKECAPGGSPPKPGDQWRVNFSRVEWDVEVLDGKTRKVANRPEHNWVWSPQGVIDMHRPERWGFVQFSAEPPGEDAFRPDPDLPARDYLHKLYYAQRTFRSKHGRWAKTVGELEVGEPPTGWNAAEVQTTESLFEIVLQSKSNPQRSWRIAQDSRCWTQG